jgi:predicted ATPase
MVESLLQTALKVCVLATSREPLGISGEQVFRLSTLAIPKEKPLNFGELLGSDAVRLFIERAKAAGARLTLNDSAAATIASICRRLDGLPLAIEMAAARTPALSLEELHQKLDDRFRLLTSVRRDALPRQETLHATLDWSYALLTEAERVLLRRVVVFAGGFTREAACFVASDLGDEPEVFDLLSRLVGRSLIVADTTGAHARYRLLETTRAFSLEKLVDPQEKNAVARRHAEHFADLFRRAPSEWLYLPDADWHARYLGERDNVRAALAWSVAPNGEQATGITLAGASARIWYELSLRAEGRRWLESALAVVQPETSEMDQAWLWVGLGLLWHVEAPAKAVPALVRGTDLYRRLGLGLELGYSLTRLATNLALMGRCEQAASTLEEALPLLTQAGIPKALASYYSSLGFLESITSKLALARIHYQQALIFSREAGDEGSALNVLGSLADVTWALGDLDSALEGFRETVALVRKSRGIKRSLLGTQLLNLASVLIERGQLVDALVPAGEGLPLCKEEGSVWMNMDHLALRAALAGDLSRAAHLAGFVDSALATREISRGPNEERARDRLRKLLRERFSPEELSPLLTDGANLTDDEACRLALED